MIAYLSGKIIFRKDDFVILDVNGIGYKIFLCPKIFDSLELKQESKFFVHHHQREDAVSLFGFSKYEELDFFEKVISVSGIGPKMALGLLSIGSIGQMKSAINNKDLDFLISVPGIGKRMAEKICFSLKGKLDSIGDDEIVSDKKELIDSLVSLGFQRLESIEVAGKIDGDLVLAGQIREALKIIKQF